MLPRRSLGSTGLDVSVLAFGAGPVSGLMTGDDRARQCAVVRRALDAGVNWFDTAATYGDGASESNLGATLRELGALDVVHVATKVRFAEEHLAEPLRHASDSVASSLSRLGLERVALLQLHNSITRRRGDEPTSLSIDDVLRAGGVADAFDLLRSRGLVNHLGLTGIGDARALAEVVGSGRFGTVQAPYNLLNPSAGEPMPADFGEADYGNLFAECERMRMGVFAIRVFAGGALAGAAPSRHTHTTRFFPLDLYRRDQARAAALAQRLSPHGVALREAAVRFVLAHRSVSSAIVGFGAVEEVDEAVAQAQRGPLAADVMADLASRRGEPTAAARSTPRGARQGNNP